jgi:signal transduction histidine kinase/CheY-like chemotaxis protein
MSAAAAVSSAGVPTVDRPVAELIEHERVNELYRMAPRAIVAGLFYCPFFAWAMTVNKPLALAWVWLAVRLGFGLLRLGDIVLFLRARPGVDQTPAWRRRGITLLAFDVAGWSLLAPVFLNHDAGVAQAMVLATLFAVAAIGTMTLFANIRAVAIFSIGMLSPCLVMLLLRQDLAGITGVVGGTIYLFVLLNEARRAKRGWDELQRLRFEHAHMAHESRRQQRLAEHASAAKSRFLATMSHELRTPLNGIVGMTQMLRAAPDDPAVGERLDTIAQSAQHLRQLIGDLVDLSRIEAGKLDMVERPFDLHTLVGDVVNLLEPAAREKGLALAVHLPDVPAPRLRGDAVRVKQVLHNLLGNAIKFTREGAVSITADWQAPMVRFEVRDSGPGVPPSQREAIFNAFEQGEQRAGGAGLGLGLTIARELARAMGGDVQLLDTPGPGSTFVFTLRAEPARHGDGTSLAQSLALPNFRAHALLVDDNAVNAEVARAMLEHLGLEVSVAVDGERALDALAAGDFDVVLMDCEMPVLDGLDATRRWREREQGLPSARHVPIVALTASAVQGDRERCLAAGMDDYLAKPFELAELAAVLYRVLPPR